LEIIPFDAIVSGMSQVSGQIENILNNTSERSAALHETLRLILADFHSETGTIHRLDGETQQLHLSAQMGLPPQMLEIIQTIPVGKGIAGQTVAQNKPITICNLQADASGVAKPGARQTGVGGALCVPVRQDGKIVGTLGIGTMRPHEYTAEETQRLEGVANLIGSRLAAGSK
jgi:putative methionine-R-sulfoxide reductase with GAF domain